MKASAWHGRLDPLLIIAAFRAYGKANEFSNRTRPNHPVERIALFLAVLSLFTVITAIFFWQWVPNLSSALLGPPEDNINNIGLPWPTEDEPQEQYLRVYPAVYDGPDLTILRLY